VAGERLIASSNAWRQTNETNGAVSLREGRRRYLVGRGLPRSPAWPLSRWAPQELRFETTAAGKPHLATGQGQLQFNLAHSGEYVLIAIADGRAVGIDVEEVRDDFDAGEIGAHFFSPDEQRELEALSGACEDRGVL
jgi:4'-phosphopantetheinyl transferase